MFSRRTSWDLRPNRLSLLVDDRKAKGLPFLDLTVSNPTRIGLEYPSEKILGALAQPGALDYSPDPKGLLSARQAIARWSARQGAGVDPDRLVVTASTSEAYAYLFKLLCDPGDEVLAPAPSYPLCEYLATLDGVAVSTYPIHYDGSWRLEVDALERQIGPRTRAVVLVHPNNPTGSYLKQQELRMLEAVCLEHGLAIISDEVFSSYAAGPDPDRVGVVALETEALSFSMSGFSKVAGLPQLKLGWIVVGGAADRMRAALERLEVIADTYLSVGTPVQLGAEALLQAGDGIRAQLCSRIATNRACVERAVRAAPAMGLCASEGGWYAILQVPRVRTEEEWAVLLLDQQAVLVQPGYFFDFAMDGLLVVSLLPPPDELDEGMARIARCVSAT